MKPWFILTTVSISVLVSSCAAFNQDSEGYSQGWRSAKVLEIGGEKSVLRFAHKDCRSEMGSNAAYRRYAVTSYSYGGSPNLKTKRIVAVPDNLLLEIGDKAYVNIVDCKIPLKK